MNTSCNITLPPPIPVSDVLVDSNPPVDVLSSPSNKNVEDVLSGIKDSSNLPSDPEAIPPNIPNSVENSFNVDPDDRRHEYQGKLRSRSKASSQGLKDTPRSSKKLKRNTFGKWLRILKDIAIAAVKLAIYYNLMFTMWPFSRRSSPPDVTGFVQFFSLDTGYALISYAEWIVMNLYLLAV